MTHCGGALPLAVGRPFAFNHAASDGYHFNLVAAGGVMPAGATSNEEINMSPRAGQLLIDQIVPRIRSAVGRGQVRRFGSEDAAELVQDGTCQAAQMLDAAEAAGKPLMPASVAYYALRALQSGRRSGVGGASRTDAMAPGAALAGRSSVVSMDAPLDSADGQEGDYTLQDTLAAPGEDAGAEAGRRLDWDQVLPRLNARQRGVLLATAEGRGPGEIAVQYEVTAPRICQLREGLGPYIVSAWGGNGIQDSATPPVWRQGMRAAQERRMGRRERAAA